MNAAAAALRKAHDDVTIAILHESVRAGGEVWKNLMSALREIETAQRELSRVGGDV